MRRMHPGGVLARTLHDAAGACPLCQTGITFGYNGPSGAVYRRSRRSLTMRCSWCGLQWTVTYHMLVRALRRALERERNPRNRPGLEEAISVLAPWAEAAKEQRGRKAA